MQFTTTVLLLLVGVVSSTRHTYDTPERHPSGWKVNKHKPADPNTYINLHFILKISNEKLLLQKLEQTSNPTSPSYGQHMTNEQVQQLTQPSKTALNTVHTYLKQAGEQQATPASTNSDVLKLNITIAQAEKILNCTYYEYIHTPSSQIKYRTSSYSLPISVSKYIAAVTPTVSLPTIPLLLPKKKKNSIHNIHQPQQLVNVPSTLRTLYGVNKTQGQSGRTKQAVTGFIKQLYSTLDFAQFQKEFLNATQMGYNVTTNQLKCVGDDGSPQLVGGGTEAMLDAEYIVSLGANITTEFWGFKGNGNDPDLWLKWMLQIGNTSDATVPKIFSCSYGEDEYTMANDYATRVNLEFVKAGVRGISILVASGDSGAADQKSHCHNKTFTPKWPAASPYITSVGGTGGIIGTYESAADLSSGGFSNRYARPKWQNSAVQNYLSNSKVSNKTKKYINNTNGRGFPDVSAQAIDFMVVSSFIPMPVMGTSCAAPTFSGIVGLLNDIREMNNKSSLGFLNPLLYSTMGMKSLNDITFGSGGGCFDNSDHDNGFPALKGWDAVTGLGSPNFPKMKEMVMKLK